MLADRRLAVLVLALAALLLRDSSLPHQHAAAGPGLYNHDHDLGTLATVAGAVVPVRPTPAAVPVAGAAPPIPVAVVLARPPRCLADPRAPPAPTPPLS